MGRTAPTTNIDTIGPIGLKPQDAVRNYMDSKAQEGFFVKPPNWDSPGESIELFFIDSEREHDAMLLLQQEMITNARRQEIINATNIVKQNKTIAKLRKRFIDVNSFMKDFHDKKNFAYRKIREEKAKQEELRAKIMKTHKSVVTLKKFREQLINTTKEYEHYEQVLQDVVDSSRIYTSIKDLMDRCDALMMAQVEITQLDRDKFQDIEIMRKQFLAITNQAALTIMGLKNELADVERAYSLAKQRCMMWEKRLEKAKTETTKIMMGRDRMLDSVYQLYRLLVGRRRKPLMYQRDDMEPQLDFIREEIIILRDVLSTIRNQGAKQKRMQVPC